MEAGNKRKRGEPLIDIHVHLDDGKGGDLLQGGDIDGTAIIKAAQAFAEAQGCRVARCKLNKDHALAKEPRLGDGDAEEGDTLFGVVRPPASRGWPWVGGGS